MKFFLNIFLVTSMFSCGIEQFEDGNYSCVLSSESSFSDGIVSCVDLEGPKLGEFAAEDACNDWDGVFLSGVLCEKESKQLGCQYPYSMAGFEVTAIAWYNLTSDDEQAAIMDIACSNQDGTLVRAK